MLLKKQIQEVENWTSPVTVKEIELQRLAGEEIELEQMDGWLSPASGTKVYSSYTWGIPVILEDTINAASLMVMVLRLCIYSGLRGCIPICWLGKSHRVSWRNAENSYESFKIINAHWEPSTNNIDIFYDCKVENTSTLGAEKTVP